MFEIFDHKLNRTIHKITIGEIYATRKQDAVLNTVLGSCVAVCLRDKTGAVYGINHFMMPGGYRENTLYGAHATNQLIDLMLKNGASKKHLEAKIFGGGKTIKNNSFEIGKNNALFIQEYLDDLNIPIVEKDLGGNNGRNIYVFCDTWEVRVKKNIKKIS